MRRSANANHVDEGVRYTSKGVGPLLHPEPIQAPGKVHPSLEKQIALNQSKVSRWKASAVQRRTRLYPRMIALVRIRGIGVLEPRYGFPRQSKAFR